MLRDVRTSPDGRMVVYSALGQLYVKDLPSGEPRRLTTDAHHEFFPSFSRDGQWIVYTTWSDADHGRVRVIQPDGTGGRDVVSRAGHYVEPSFSPDGRQIVFRRWAATMARGPLHAAETGIFVVPAAGGEPVLVRESGAGPEFDHTGTRIYVRENRNEKFTLLSVGLPTGRLAAAGPRRDRAHPVRQRHAVRTVARRPVDRLPGALPHVHCPVPADGPSQSTSARARRRTPFSACRGTPGFYLHWSGDSGTLHWTLGPELFSRRLGQTFSFVEGAEAKAAEPEAGGIPIGFTARADRPEGTLALVGARIITMAGLQPGPIRAHPASSRTARS
jgi:hypothetical protein